MLVKIQDSKRFGKSTLRFEIFDYMVNSFGFFLHMTIMTIAYKNYSKFCKRKYKKQHFVYCDYHEISVIYINCNMALLRVRNH